ncbi:MAG: response regulator [Planctomycetaceae bacterium]|nr:response regulator [Planctomycetaceae bacterium]
MCSNWGMIPTVAVSAAEAIRLIQNAIRKQQAFQLVLSDVNMPKADGFTLAEWIRSEDGGKDIPIILLTSSGRPGDAERRRVLNIAANLLKPVKQSDLFDAVVTVLNVEAAEDEVHLSHRPGDEGSAARSLNILLAEDNLVNQKLALGVLGKLGHRVTIANNGQEACEHYGRQRFDIVLMDVQMPLMDGFQACAAIREIQQQDGRRIPVIAMTAHAMKGDRERCLEAGMDEYLSKPIRTHQLAEVLNRITRNSAPEESATPAERTADLLNGSSNEPGSGVMNPSIQLIDWEHALAGVDGDRDLLRTVAIAFLEENSCLEQDLQTSITKGDLNGILRTGHTLKGALMAMGATRTAAITQQFEQLKPETTVTDAAKLMDRLQQHLIAVRNELQSFVDESE